MFIGIPLFPGSNNFDQLNLIIEMLGPPPDRMFNNADYASNYFNISPENKHELKSYEEYSEAS